MKLILLFINICVSLNTLAQAIGTPAPLSGERPLIIGGRKVSEKNKISKTTVSLLNKDDNSICTGSIIAKNIIITAAHCVDGSNPRAMLVSFGVSLPGREIRQVARFAAHPNWGIHQNNNINNADIALVEFSGALPKNFSKVKMMNKKHELRNGDSTILAGYGITGRNDDSEILRTVSVKIANANYSETEISLDQRNKKGACHGDSGGPAFIKDNHGNLFL